MPDSSESSPRTSFAKRKRLIAISIAGLFVLIGLIFALRLKIPIRNNDPPTVVIRIDDIQDFAFREAQLFLLNESMTNDVPLSLAVITGLFGDDKEIVQTVKLAVTLGSDLAVHGWKHENLTKLSFAEQLALLSQSKSRIKELLDLDTRVLVPPTFSFNEDTVAAMHEEGYNIISTITDYTEPGLISNVVSLPATIELSDFSNGTWSIKSLDSIQTEIAKSIQKYGYAVIVTHPQEFIADGILNQTNTELYRTLLKALKENYSLDTLERLSENLEVQP